MITKMTVSFNAGIILLMQANAPNIEVISIKDGKTIQTLKYFDSSAVMIFDCQIKNTKLIAVDTQGNFITATFQIPP